MFGGDFETQAGTQSNRVRIEKQAADAKTCYVGDDLGEAGHGWLGGGLIDVMRCMKSGAEWRLFHLALSVLYYSNGLASSRCSTPKTVFLNSAFQDRYTFCYLIEHSGNSIHSQALSRTLFCCSINICFQLWQSSSLLPDSRSDSKSNSKNRLAKV